MSRKWFKIYKDIDIMSERQITFDKGVYKVSPKSLYQQTMEIYEDIMSDSEVYFDKYKYGVSIKSLYQQTIKVYEVRHIKTEYQYIIEEIYEARRIKSQCQDIIKKIMRTIRRGRLI